MRKLAVFVEGQTEQLFVERFVTEVAGQNNVTVHSRKAFGGSRRLSRRFTTLTGADPGGREYYVLIYDSATDGRVASDILENYQRLVASGYSSVLGVRDVYPVPRSDIPATRTAIAKILPKGSIPVHLVLCIMEIEAWFIGEYTHFAKMDARITLQEASNAIGENVESVDVQGIDHPADVLDRVYSVAGLRYDKKKKTIRRILDKLDFDRLYLELRGRIGALEELCEALDAFLVRDSTTNPVC